MSTSTGRSGWFGRRKRKRKRTPAQPDAGPITAVLTPGAAVSGELTGNGVDENIPASIRLAGAWAWRLLVIAAAIAVLLFLVVQLRFIVIPLLVAVLVSALLVPFVGFLTRHRWPKGLAVALALLGTLLVVAGLVTLAVTQIAAGSAGLSARFSAAYANLTAALAASPLQLSEGEINRFFSDAVDMIQTDSAVFITGALSVGSSLGHLITGVLLALFSLLFILIDGKSIWQWIVRIFPRRARAAVDGAGVAGWTTLGNFARVQILVASIDAVGIGAGAAILGVPMAVPIGVLVFLGSFIPIVGAVATGAVAVVIALIFNDWFVALLMLAVVLLVQQIEGHVLQPLIMGTAVKVHPLGVVLVVAAGALLAGIPGALFAVPVAAVLNVMISYIHSGAWRGDLPPVGSPAGSVLWQIVPQRPGFRQPRDLSPTDTRTDPRTAPARETRP